MQIGSLVLYKNRPGRIAQLGDKLHLQVEGGKGLKVRPKDVVLLHPGPLDSFTQLTPREGEVETAWELLAGSTTSLPELTELAFGDYTPATTWAAWQLVADGLYFTGSPEAIEVLTATAVEEERQRRQQRRQEQQDWDDLLARLRQGQTAPQDQPHLLNLEAFALGRQTRNRLLAALDRAENQEEAHALLLAVDHWTPADNPYPRRLDLPTTPCTLALDQLPEEDRLDLTHLRALAIDDEGNTDPDDALSLEDGRLWVHVADVAALVPPGSPVAEEACARGANLYLPEGTVPMLPAAATQQLGLGLQEISPALSIGLDLDSNGTITAVEVAPSWVRVERLTYAQAQEKLGGGLVGDLYQVAENAQAQRWTNGAVFIELPEVRVRAVEGQVSITPLPALQARDLVGEAMLLAGEGIARFALERGLAIPFSTQPPPEQREIPEGLAGMYALRRSLQPSQLRSTLAPHAGLGLDAYVQTTSPLRRYLDLLVHQQVRAVVRNQPPLDDQAVLELVGASQEGRSRVRQAERLSNRHWTLVYLAQHPDWRGEGVLVDRQERRCRVLIAELSLEIQLSLDSSIPLNGAVPLRLHRVDLPRLEPYFVVDR
ncbi:MAG: RNB domain-containing ribonuclease [Candidatus Latescibacteria bacterium]|nr:RNB domain-containing ribonuclease [Candidatus Latescibacterota bacterium]